MTSSVPSFRSVCQLTGEKADPSQFFEALSEASSFCAELDSVRELQCRIQELEAELDECKLAASALRFAASAEHDQCDQCEQIEKRLSENLRGES